MTGKFQQPGPLKAKLLAWSEFNSNEIDTFLLIFKSPNSNEIYPYLEKMLDLNSSYFKSKILLDLHYYALKFAIDNGFSKIQISAFISILRALHKANQETPFENYQQIIKYFHELMICHSIKRPPFCVDIFCPQTAAKIVNFITNTYLRHYKFYKYAFTPMVNMRLEMAYQNRTPSPTIESETDSVLPPDERVKTPSSMDTSIQTNKFISNENSYTSEDNVHVDMRNFIKKVMKEYLESENIKKELGEMEQAKFESMAHVSSSSNINNKKK